jgi:hypothetical protein
LNRRFNLGGGRDIHHVWAMTKARIVRKRLTWRVTLVTIAVMAVWFGLIFWGAHFWMPLEYTRPVTLWSVGGVFVVALGILSWLNRPQGRRRKLAKLQGSLVMVILTISAASAIFLGVAVGSVLLGCNGTFRRDEPFIVEGTVTAKYVNGGRTTTYLVEVEEKTPARTLTFGFNRKAYERVRIGDQFHEEFQVGLFGWPCRPR